MSIVTAAALVFGIVFATADEASQNVKNKTAAGQYGYEDAYYGQNFYDDFDYNIYNYARNTLINNAFTGVFDRSKVDNGYSSTSCDRCCKIAARLDRITESLRSLAWC
uniref:Secreted protein n=1 Tax=Angiostrongylus cantonensis TaxID=6313 RepID=A0A0K0DJ42_ANGCA